MLGAGGVFERLGNNMAALGMFLEVDVEVVN